MAKKVTNHTEASDDSLTPRHLTKQEFAKRLHKLLTDRRWNQSDLSRAAGIGRDAVSTYIRGRSFPEGKNLEAIAKALQMRPEDLLPNTLESAIQFETPAIELRVSHSDPSLAWLKIDQRVSMSVAAEILSLLKKDETDK
jgi:transcriptional regulator with XRE-family HTH domain